MDKRKTQDEFIDKVLFYCKLGCIGLLLLIALFDSIYFVSDTETAVVTTFGKAIENTNKGMQFKIPFFQDVTKVDTTVRGFTIGYNELEDGTMVDVDAESIMITSDYNFIDIDYDISYQVSDAKKFLYASSNPELILKNITMNCIRSTLSAYTVDSALTTGKAEISANIKSAIIDRLEQEDIGIVLIEASMQDVEPPTDMVRDAFKAVETAKQNKETAINVANTYRNQQIPAAEASVDKITQEAEAMKTARINEANGLVARFNAEYEEYKNYPLITKQRMFYETMGELLPNLKVIIDNGNGDVEKYYPVESFTGN